MEQAGLARGGGGGGGWDCHGVDWGHYSGMNASFSADKAPRSHPADPEVGLASRETSREEHLCVQQKAGSSKRTQPRKAGDQWAAFTGPLSKKLWR